MKVRLAKVGPVASEAIAGSGGQAIIDGKEAIGGEGRGMRPMEALLMALGSCSAMDVVYILRKQKEPLDDLTIDVDAERGEGTPSPFTAIHLTFTATRAGLSEKKVQRAVALSVEKYCSVGLSLSDAIAVTHETVVREG